MEAAAWAVPALVTVERRDVVWNQRHATQEETIEMPFDASTLESLVAAAVAAPSSHNTQPWRFDAFDDTIELSADRTRALPVNDPEGRELVISCGAALFNLCVAADAAAIEATVEAAPHDAAPDLLARVHLRPARVAGRRALAAAIDGRHTYRKPFEDRPIGTECWERLRAAAAAGGATLLRVDGERRELLAGMIASGDRQQFANREWRRELASWMRPPSRGDGLTSPELVAPLVRLAVRSFDVGTSRATLDRRRALAAPILALLGTPDDTPAAWLRCGQALEHVLLTATTGGIQASFFNQPCQVAPLRQRLQALLPDAGAPQVVLGLGYPRVPSPGARRRPLDEVLTHVAAQR